MKVKGYTVGGTPKGRRSLASYRHTVRKFIGPGNLEQMCILVWGIGELLRLNGIGGVVPGPRFLLMRLCSAVGVKPLPELADIGLSNTRGNYEYLLFGFLYQKLKFHPEHCPYYMSWTDDVLRQFLADRTRYVCNEWKPWQEHWRLQLPEKPKPIVITDPDVEHELYLMLKYNRESCDVKGRHIPNNPETVSLIRVSKKLDQFFRFR